MSSPGMSGSCNHSGRWTTLPVRISSPGVNELWRCGSNSLAANLDSIDVTVAYDTLLSWAGRGCGPLQQ